MGSCVSFSRSPPAEERSSTQRAPVPTAKVVNLDGSMAQFTGPVTAREALGGRAPPLFLCGSDELRFDAPARALAAGEALRPGQLYFVLPARMLRRPLSGDDMAALAVRAATALAIEAGLAAGGGGVMSPQRRRRTKQGGAAGKGPRRRRSTARVAPLLVVSGNGKEGPSDGSRSNINDTAADSQRARRSYTTTAAGRRGGEERLTGAAPPAVVPTCGRG